MADRMMPVSPLRHFPFYATRDPDVTRNVLLAHGVTDYEVTTAASDYEQRVNRVVLRDLAVAHSTCAAGVRFKIAPANFVRQRICLTGTARSTSGSLGTALDARRWSAMVPAGESGGALDLQPGYQELRVVIDDGLMRRKLGELLGDAPVGPIAFAPDNDVQSQGLVRFRRLLSFLLSELDIGGPVAPGAVIDELGEALLLSLLFGQKHNFSDRLVRPEVLPSPTQQRRVEALIESRWSEPLSITDMVKVANVSARSIFRNFREAHGCSPREYVKRVRLRKAQQMLQRDDRQLTVTAVALKCGFHSLGHFASSYREAFGELPSETLLRARR